MSPTHSRFVRGLTDDERRYFDSLVESGFDPGEARLAVEIEAGRSDGDVVSLDREAGLRIVYWPGTDRKRTLVDPKTGRIVKRFDEEER